MAKHVRDVMHREMVVCDADATLVQAATIMRDEDVRMVVVMKGRRVRGVVSEHDIVMRCVARGLDLGRAMVTDACPAEMIVASPEMTANEARELMNRASVGCLPVVDDGQLVGVLHVCDSR